MERDAADAALKAGRGGARNIGWLASLSCALMMLAAACGQSPHRLAARYLADLQQFNYPACYATLTDEDRAARPLKQFLIEIPLAPDVDPIWFRAILFSTRYEIGEPQVKGEHAVVPVKVTMPDLTLWERTIDAKAGPQDSLNAAADRSLQVGDYPKLRFEDALVMIKERHEWRVLANFPQRDLIRDGEHEAVETYHRQDLAKAAAQYRSLIGQLEQHSFSGSRGLKFRFSRRLKTIENIQEQMPAARAYFSRLVLSDVAVKMSESRVPAIFGRINNAGDRGIDEVRLTVTYYAAKDPRKALYQETHSVIETPIEFTGFRQPVLPFVPGETRDVGFELNAPPQIQQQAEPSLTVGSIVFTQSRAPLPTLAVENAPPSQPPKSASPSPSSMATGGSVKTSSGSHPDGAASPGATPVAH